MKAKTISARSLNSRPEISNITIYSKPPWLAVMGCQTARSFAELATGYIRANEALSLLSQTEIERVILGLSDRADHSLLARLVALRKKLMGE